MTTTPLPPTVLGPISECNTEIGVEGQITGSTVKIYRVDEQDQVDLVAEGTASWASQRFSLEAGKKLNPGDEIYVVQEVADVESKPSPLLVKVQKAPATPASPVFSSPLYECASCTLIRGAVPGARVQVGVMNGADFEVRGERRAPYGEGRQIHISPSPAIGETLYARQIYCDMESELTIAPPIAELPAPGGGLPSPVLDTPLRHCDRTVTVRNVLPGAIVILHRSSGDTQRVCFDRDNIYLVMDPPLSSTKKYMPHNRL